MKYLKEAFEKAFTEEQKYTDSSTQEKKVRIVHNGLKFEELTKNLLEKLYPEAGEWQSTLKSHDGSRDYFAQISERLLWAECKNYVKNIALSTIAPTLVMAQICNVDELLFFSASPMNFNTKKKLCFYAHINKKIVKFYDGDVLEQLLFKYNDVLEQYLGKVTSKTPESGEDVTVFHWIQKNPFLNARKDEYEFSQTSTTIKLKYNDIISISYAIINDSVSDSLNVTFNLCEDCDDYDCFALLNRQDEDMNSRSICIHKILKPNEMYFRSFDFRIIHYKSNLQLPKIQLTYEKESLRKVLPASEYKVECSWMGKAQLVGAKYEAILERFEQEILNIGYLSGILLYGSSGTGKTRLLEDSIRLMIKYDYKILNFIGIVDDSGINVIKEIVYVLFELSENFICLNRFDDIIPDTLRASTEIERVLEFLRLLSSPDIDIKAILHEYGIVIYEKLAREKYVLVIDNLQYFDDILFFFIEELIRYSKNDNRNNQLSLMLVINTDYVEDNSSCMKLKRVIEQLENAHGCKFLSESVDGFNDPQTSLNFVKQILRLKSEDYDKALLKLIHRLSSKPYYIEQAVVDLFNDGILQFVNNALFIKEPELFVNSLEQIPDSINETIKHRWEFLIQKYPHKEMDLKVALSIIHLCRKVSDRFCLRIHLDQDILMMLYKHHFIKREDKNDTCYFSFDHDLVENFFCHLYMNFSDFGVSYLYEDHMRELEKYCLVAYNICKLKCEKMIFAELNEYARLQEQLSIPYKILYTYYELLAEKYLGIKPLPDQTGMWIVRLDQICRNIRDRLGNLKSENLYCRIYERIVLERKYLTEYGYSEYVALLFTLCETFEHLGLSEKVIRIYNEHLRYFRQLKGIGQEEIRNETITFIHNRLHIAYKKRIDPLSLRMQRNHLRKSLQLSKKLENKRYLAENLFDEGNLYYDFDVNREKVLRCWERGCELVTCYHVDLMTLHKIKKQIQIHFIKGSIQSIPKLVRKGLQYIEHGTYNEFPLFFSGFFHLAQAMAMIMDGSFAPADINEELSNAESDYLLFGRNRTSIINFLRGKLAAKQQNLVQAYQFYCAAYQDKSNEHLALVTSKANYDILAEDMILALRSLNANLSEYPLHFVTLKKHKERLQYIFSLSNTEFEQYMFSYRSNALCRSVDGKEGYPSI